MKKAAIVGNVLSSLFVLFISYLTIQYFYRNRAISQEYEFVLSFFCSANLILLLWYSVARRGREEYNVLLWIIVIILSGSIIKSLFTRNVSGIPITGFQYYFTFNEEWSLILKFLWHATLDLIMLFTVYFLKNFPLWIENRK